MNGLSNSDKTYSEYPIAPRDDLVSRDEHETLKPETETLTCHDRDVKISRRDRDVCRSRYVTETFK